MVEEAGMENEPAVSSMTEYGSTLPNVVRSTIVESSTSAFSKPPVLLATVEAALSEVFTELRCSREDSSHAVVDVARLSERADIGLSRSSMDLVSSFCSRVKPFSRPWPEWLTSSDVAP